MGQGCSEFGIEEAQRLLDEDWRQGSAFRVDPKIAEIIGVGEGTTSQPVPRCPRRCRSCALHRIGVQLTQRKGDDVSHDGSLFSLFPRTGLMPEGAGAPLLLPELARSSGGEGGKGTSRRGLPTFCKHYFCWFRSLLSRFRFRLWRGFAALRCNPCLAASSGCASGVGAFAGNRLHGALQRRGSWAEGAPKRAEGGALSVLKSRFGACSARESVSWRRIAPRSPARHCTVEGFVPGWRD